MERMSWDSYFMEICNTVSSRSPCISRKIGAIAVKEGRFVIATGYNGPPSGFPHCVGMIEDRVIRNSPPYENQSITLEDSAYVKICPRKAKGYKSGEGLETCPAQHAERNVVCEAARLGHSLLGCIMYINTNQVCRECAKAIVNAGITEVVLTGNIPYPESGITGLEVLNMCRVNIRIVR